MNCTNSENTKQRSGALHLTQKVDYGIILLANLANTREKTSIKTIAEESNISTTYLQKIARTLKKAGIIKAERGKYGGYTLNKKAEELDLKTIIEALEGEIAIAPCLKQIITAPCKQKTKCTIWKKLAEVNQDISKYLSKTKISHFI